MAKILITGGNGFIGSALALELYKRGDQVYIIDKVDTANQILIDYKDKADDEELETLEKNIKMVCLDLESVNAKLLINELQQIDLVIHLASPIGVDKIINNPNGTVLSALKLNTLIHEACETTGTPLIFSSSSEVFGSCEIDNTNDFSIKKPEDSPRWGYAAQKVLSEFIYHNGNYPSCNIRFFNVIGSGQSTPGMIMVEFMKAAITNEQLVILEDGIRNYCSIDDAVYQVILIAQDLVLNKYHSGYNKKGYNIGSGREDNTISALSLAKKVIEITNSTSEIIISNAKEALPVRILREAPLASNSKGLDEIIKEIYNYKKDKQ